MSDFTKQMNSSDLLKFADFFYEILPVFLLCGFIENTVKIRRIHCVLQFTRVETDNTYCWQGYSKPSTFKHAGGSVTCTNFLKCPRVTHMKVLKTFLNFGSETSLLGTTQKDTPINYNREKYVQRYLLQYYNIKNGSKLNSKKRPNLVCSCNKVLSSQ